MKPYKFIINSSILQFVGVRGGGEATTDTTTRFSVTKIDLIKRN